MKSALTQLISGIEFDVLTCYLAMIFLMVAGCSAQKNVEPPQEIFPMKQVSVNGINISYIEEGEGVPMVFVHGIPTSSFLWRDMIGELSAHSREIVYCLLRTAYCLLLFTELNSTRRTFPCEIP